MDDMTYDERLHDVIDILGRECTVCGFSFRDQYDDAMDTHDAVMTARGCCGPPPKAA
jgi:hypothetical protein